jgi:hypothetical protein
MWGSVILQNSGYEIDIVHEGDAREKYTCVTYIVEEKESIHNVVRRDSPSRHDIGCCYSNLPERTAKRTVNEEDRMASVKWLNRNTCTRCDYVSCLFTSATKGLMKLNCAGYDIPGNLYPSTLMLCENFYEISSTSGTLCQPISIEAESSLKIISWHMHVSRLWSAHQKLEKRLFFSIAPNPCCGKLGRRQDCVGHER